MAASGSTDPPGARAHLNLVESSRRLFELDPGAVVEDADGWMLGAGTPSHPAISNAAFRVDDGADPERFIAAARDFFGDRGRGFVVWARDPLEEDRDLASAAEAAGLEEVYRMPEMLLSGRAVDAELPEGAELRRLSTAEEAAEYWRIAASAYTSVGFPPDVFGFYEGLERLADGEHAEAFLAYLGGVPVSIGMTIVNHGVAGVYWIGSLSQAAAMASAGGHRRGDERRARPRRRRRLPTGLPYGGAALPGDGIRDRVRLSPPALPRSLARFGLEHVHPDHEAVLEPPAMDDARVGDRLARIGVVDDLMDLDRDAPILATGESLRLNPLEIAENCRVQ